jgi:hypothetical protein
VLFAVGDEADLFVAPRARFVVRDLDPLKPAFLLGAYVRWTRGRYAVTGDPYLQAGLGNTELGNRHALFVPVKLSAQVSRVELALRTGWHSDLAVWRDGWHIPVAVATRVRIGDHVDAGAMLAFASLLGPQNTAKERALFFSLGFTADTGWRAARSRD